MSAAALIYLISRAVPGVLQLLGLAVYTRLVTPAQFGTYIIVLTTISMLSATLFRGLIQTQVRYLPEARRSNQTAQMERTLGGLLALTLVIVMAVSFITQRLLAPGWDGHTLGATVLLAAFVLVDFSIERERAKGSPRAYAALSAARTVLVVGSLTLSLLFSTPTAHTMVWAHGMSLSLLLLIIFALRGPLTIGTVSRSWMRRIARYGAPLVLVAALQVLLSLGDRFLLAWRADSELVGAYSAAYTLAEYTIVLLLSAVHLASFPILSRLWAEGHTRKVVPALQQTLLLLLGVGVPACASLIVMSPHVARVLGSEFRQVTPMIIFWVAPALVCASLRSFYFDSILHLHERTHAIVAPLAVAACLNVALNFWLIPILGLQAPAMATLASYATALLLGAAASRRVWSPPTPWRQLRYLAICCCGFLAIQIFAWHRDALTSALITVAAWLVYLLSLVANDLRRGQPLGSSLRPHIDDPVSA